MDVNRAKLYYRRFGEHMFKVLVERYANKMKCSTVSEIFPHHNISYFDSTNYIQQAVEYIKKECNISRSEEVSILPK
jgi:hypothetical protein